MQSSLEFSAIEITEAGLDQAVNVLIDTGVQLYTSYIDDCYEYDENIPSLFDEKLETVEENKGNLRLDLTTGFCSPRKCSRNDVQEEMGSLDINDQCEEIFKNFEKDKPQSVALRRDVINKAILRGMKKFMAKHFRCKFRTANMSFKTIFSKLRSHVINVFEASQGKSIISGLVAEPNQSMSDLYDSVIDLIIWSMVTPHLNAKISKLYHNAEPIAMLNDILISYSHTKLSTLLGTFQIKVLFKFFKINGEGAFLARFSGEKLDKYREALEELYHNC